MSIDGGANYITSDNPYTFENKKLVVVAKRTDNSDSYVRIAYKNGYSFTTLATFGYGTSCSNSNELYDSNNYIEVTTGNLSVTAQNIRITVKNAKVKSIKLSDTKSLSLDETNPTSLLKGSKTENVILKYTPSTGWNTICVPFQLKSGSSYEHLTSIFGTGWKAFTLSSYENGTLTFTSAAPYSYSSINANVPILVYTENTFANPNEVILESNVNISYPGKDATPSTTKGTATFQGSYAPITTGNMPDGSYGITSAGKIVNAGANSSIKGYRAYLTGLPSGAGARIVTIDCNDDETTDMGFVKMVDPEVREVYSMSGQRVQKARKGIYVVNGKKIVVK